jgi:hypothetical protein
MSSCARHTLRTSRLLFASTTSNIIDHQHTQPTLTATAAAATVLAPDPPAKSTATRQRPAARKNTSKKCGCSVPAGFLAASGISSLSEESAASALTGAGLAAAGLLGSGFGSCLASDGFEAAGAAGCAAGALGCCDASSFLTTVVGLLGSAGFGAAAGAASEAGLRRWIMGISSSESDISTAGPGERMLRNGNAVPVQHNLAKKNDRIRLQVFRNNGRLQSTGCVCVQFVLHKPCATKCFYDTRTNTAFTSYLM